MRKRKWVLFAFIVFIAIGMSFFQAWRLLQANEKLKKIILTEVNPVLGDSTNIERVKVGYGNIHIMGIQFYLPQKNISIRIADLRIGYNFINYLANGFDAAQLSQDVLAVNPQITFYHSANSNSFAQSDSNSLNGTRKFLQKLSDINRISIKNGEFFYSYSDSENVKLIHNIDGGLFKIRQDSLLLQIRGRFLNSNQENVWVHGHYNLQEMGFDNISASLNYYNLQDVPFFPKDKFDVTNGGVNAQFHILPNETPGILINGKALLTDVSGDILQDKANVTDLHAMLTFTNDSLVVSDCRGKLNNADFTFQGDVFDFSNPAYSAEFNSNNLALSKFSHLFGEKFKNNLYGALQVHSTISGKKNAGYQLQTGIYANKIKYQKLTANQVSAVAQYDGSLLSVKNAQAHVLDNVLQGELEIDFSSTLPQIAGQISGSGQARELFAMDEFSHITAIETQLNAEISGALADPIVLGNVHETAVTAALDTFQIPAAFSLHNKHIRIVSTNASQDFKLNAHINFNTQPWSINTEFYNVGAVAAFLFPQHYNPLLTPHFLINTNINGVINNYKVTSSIDWEREALQEQRVVHMETDVFKNESGWNADGRFVLHPGQAFEKLGGYTFLSRPEYVQLSNLYLDNEFSANFIYHYKQDSTISGSVHADRLPIDDLLYYENMPFAGSLSSDISISGRLDKPVLKGNIDLESFVYKGIGPYHLYLNSAYDSSGLKMDRFTLGTDNSTLLFAEGNYDQPNDLLHFAVKGAGFDLSEIIDLAADSIQCSGQTLVDLEVHGKPANPQIVGILAVKDGKVGKNVFDRFELLLADVAEDSVDRPPGVYIAKASISNNNHWHVRANGFVPFDKSDSMRITLFGEGNFLYVLSENIDFIQNAQSSGVLDGTLRGTPARPLWSDTELEMENILLEFRNTIPQVSQAAAHITYHHEDNFFQIDFLNGQMGGKPFHISAELARDTYCEKYIQDLRISAVNLGVLALKTPDKGVPLNFAGLMEPKKFATLDLLGINEKEAFYLGGYDDDTVILRGQIDVYDGEIMYPFYQRKSPPNPQVRNFLRGMEWDLLVIPKKNVRYAKTFPGAIDEAYVDLQLDEDTGALEFSGQLHDETFNINGLLRSNTGFIEYLDMNFRVETAGVEFDRAGLAPVAYGRASTTYTDSIGLSSKIYLTLQTVDNTMSKQQVDEAARNEQERARFDQIRFKLSSDNPNLGTTEAQILAMLGYSSSNLQEGALTAIGQGTDNIIFRPLFRPIERKLEESLRLDYVRFSSPFTKNLLLNNLQSSYVLDNRLALLKSTKIVVGKYFANSVFLQYTGQVESGFDYAYKGDNLGWHHTFGLEYRINPQLLVELQYDYDSLLRYDRDDKRIVLRHWFPF